LFDKAQVRPWRYHPNQSSTRSEVSKAEEALKQAIMEKYFRELPYQVGIKVEGWVPKLNGELRIDFHVDVKNEV
jgi:GTPase Era involved in 16S rRNA processing